MSDPEPQNRPRIHPGTFVAIALVMLGGILVFFNYLRYHNQNALAQYKALHGLSENVRPPLVGKLEEDLEAFNRGTEEVNLGQMKGKVWVGSFYYTHCAENCLEMTAALNLLAKELEDETRFHLIAFSVDSKRDSPERVVDFMDKAGMDPEDWWYLTEKKVELEDYVREWVQLQPSRPQVDEETGEPTGDIRHDMRVFLVDGKANVRGYYKLLEPEVGSLDLVRLRRDIQYLLENETTPAEGTTNSTPTP